jgi:hypothetical protein
LLGFLSPEFEEHRANIKLREFYFVEGDTRQPGAVPSLCKIARLTEQAIAAEKALARVRQSDTFREISFGR